MKSALVLTLIFIGGYCLLPATNGFADEALPPETSRLNTNAITIEDLQRACLQLQEEIQATQLVLERGQENSQTAIRRAVEDMAGRFQILEESLNARQTAEFKVMQSTNQLILTVAGGFVALVFIALLFISYFQWRVASRLAEFASVRPTLLSVANSRALTDGGTAASNQAVEQANARLLGVVDQLQRRIIEFEKAARAPLKEPSRTAPARADKV